MVEIVDADGRRVTVITVDEKRHIGRLLRACVGYDWRAIRTDSRMYREFGRGCRNFGAAHLHGDAEPVLHSGGVMEYGTGDKRRGAIVLPDFIVGEAVQKYLENHWLF